MPAGCDTHATMQVSRSPARILVVVALAVVALTACSRPGEERCTEVCEHFIDLRLDDEFAERKATADTDEARKALQVERDARRKEIHEKEERGFEVCVNRCNRRSRGDSADCVMEADTLEEAKACDGDDSACGCTVGKRPPQMPWSALVLGLAALVLVVRRRSDSSA